MKISRLVGGIILSALMIVSCASAIMVYVEPHQINSGDELRVYFNDLPDGPHLSLAVEMMMDAVPGGEFSFITSNITMPFELADGTVSCTNQNTDYNTILLYEWDESEPEDSHLISVSGYSVNGVFTKSLPYDEKSGTWQLDLGGTVLDRKSNVVTSFTIAGTKVSGDSDSVIPFRVYSSEPGTIKITIMADGAVVFVDQITIGNPTSKTGNIYVSTIPSGANVFIDGILYGTTPRIIKEVPPGDRVVKITMQGYSDYQKTVRVTASRLVTMTGIRLEATSGSISVSSIPWNADVYLDSVLVGQTPVTIENVAPGTYQIKVSKTGYKDYLTTVQVVDGKPVKIGTIRLWRDRPFTAFNQLVSSEDTCKDADNQEDRTVAFNQQITSFNQPDYGSREELLQSAFDRFRALKST